MFAEGTRSHDGSVARLKSGAAMLAAQQGVPLVPVYVTRHQRGHAPGAPLDGLRARLFGERHQIEIRFGEPIARAGARSRPRPWSACACSWPSRAPTPARPARRTPRAPARLVARVFLTGGSGFIGGALTSACASAATRSWGWPGPTRPPHARRRGAEVVRGNVLDQASLAAGMGGATWPSTWPASTATAPRTRR